MSRLKRIPFFRRRPLGALGPIIILVVVLTGVFGPLVAPYEPDDIGVAKKYIRPSWHGTLLGADQCGRDVLSRMLYGARISLVVGVVASTAGTLVGAMLGLMSGYWGGRTDAIMQRFIDILMSFPLIILALTLLTALQRSLATVIVAIGVPFIPYGARVVRASALVIKEIQFIEAARAIGCSDLRIIARHIAPSCVSLYLILTTGFIGVAIITESALGFLGLSIPPPTLPWVGCFPKPWLSSCSPRTWPLLQGYSSHWPCSRSMSLEMLCVTYLIHVYAGEARRGGRRNMRLSPSALGEETRGLSCSV